MNPDPTGPTPAAPSPWRWWVCILLFAATTLNYMDRIALNQMAVRIQTALSLSDKEYLQLESGFSFAFAAGALFTGFLVDKVSVRWVYPVVVLGWSAAGVLTGYATGFAWLFACRVALGLFEAGNWPCGIRTTRIVLRPEERSFGNSLFQSGTAVGAIVTPGLVLGLVAYADAAAGGPAADSWKLPFKAIGLIGFVWVVLWFLTVPRRVLVPRADTDPPASRLATRYVDVFRDRRFWALLAMAIGINVAWHTYRPLLPKYLQQVRGLTEAEMTGFTTAFYLAADVGSWTIGLLTLVLIRRGRPGHSARMLAFTGCAGLAVVSVAVPFLPTGAALVGGVLVFAFGALGLFPTYFAMTQEVSAVHQGKVTGTLGAGAHLFLSLVMYPIQGAVIQGDWASDAGLAAAAGMFGEVREKLPVGSGSYDVILAVAGLFPLLALGVVAWLWPSERPAPAPA